MADRSFLQHETAASEAKPQDGQLGRKEAPANDDTRRSPPAPVVHSFPRRRRCNPHRTFLQEGPLQPNSRIWTAAPPPTSAGEDETRPSEPELVADADVVRTRDEVDDLAPVPPPPFPITGDDDAPALFDTTADLGRPATSPADALASNDSALPGADRGKVLAGDPTRPEPENAVDDEEPSFSAGPPSMADALFGGALLDSTFVAGEKQVVIHTREGQAHRGSLRNVDLEASTLPLETRDGTVRLPVDRVRTVFFMVPIGGTLPEPRGRKATVVFEDGRPLSCLVEEYRDDAPGFFLTPLQGRGRTERIYVYRQTIRSIFFT